jgi:hypothetical protein
VIRFIARPTGKIALVAALALLTAGLAQAAHSAKVIATGQQLKDGKTSYAQATVKSPTKVSAKISVTPSQKVTISYSLTCSKGAAVDADNYDSSTTPSTGKLSLTAPVTQVLKLPFAHPKSCAVVVYSQFAKKAKSTLQILQG